MIQTIRAVFREGAFCPSTPCDFPENAEVDLLAQETSMHRPCVTDAEQRELILRRITERMQNNPLPPTASRFSRDELHERD